MKYQSELIKEIVETRGHEKSSLHYESECVETWIAEAKGAYPKLCDYQSEWLDYINENPIGNFPYVVLSDVTEATVDNVVPYAYKSAILKGNTLVNLSENKGYTTLAFTSTQTYKPVFQYNIESYKPNTKYLVITEFNHDYKYNFGVNIPHASSIFNENILIENGVGRVYKHILTTKSDLTGCNTALRTVVYNNTEETDFSQTFRIMIIEYQEGMENWDIPYFEDMQSVKVPVLTTSNEDGTKTNILSCNEEIILRSNGSVCDELDLLTGKLTQRIDEDGEILAQEVVKTVDLSIQDQNGKTLSVIKPIEGKMHLSTSSDTIKPLFSGEIPVEAITQNLASFIDLEMEE